MREIPEVDNSDFQRKGLYERSEYMCMDLAIHLATELATDVVIITVQMAMSVAKSNIISFIIDRHDLFPSGGLLFIVVPVDDDQYLFERGGLVLIDLNN